MFIAFSVLWLIVPIVGFVMALVTRQRNPQRSVYAMIGFGALALDAATSLVFSISLATSGVSDDPFHGLVHSAIVQIARQLVQLIGWASLFMALFWTDRHGRPPQSTGTGPQFQGAPGQQHPAPQYPAPQHAGPQHAGPQYPGPQYPGQQYPGQQYPGQQYPGQQYPGQQDPAQQHFPGQPMPGQQPPGQPYPGAAPPQ